ncbi:MAG: cyclophane-forming radical SAM/SPASM peptide maturase YhhB, partial [Flavobacterium sp.]|nr:cyclophane-forming radical SAM/SPASM peptide maturase YhhB [Flavobacterium sp.]
MGVDFVHKEELDTILIKVASRCNINCSYCYVYNMGDDNWLHMEKLMSFETIQAISKSLKELSTKQSKLFSVVLHGGEPFLLGAKKMDTYFSLLRESLPSKYPISIQTNGILITNELLDICSKYKVSVAVSLDGPKDVNDKLRVSHKNTGTFDDVMKGFEILKKHKNATFLNAGLLAVIDPTSNPVELYSFFKEIGAPSVDFLYKDGNHSRLPNGKSNLYSTEYGEWMVGLLNTYLNDINPLPIRILDDMLKVILGGVVSKEGMGLTDFGIIIIDTNGTLMKNDTLKSSYNGADKFSKPINIKDCNLTEFINTPEFKKYREMQKPTSAKCLNCPVLSICGGG